MAVEIDKFIQATVRTGILNRKQIEAARDALPADQSGSAEVLADALVRGELLTPFQAQKLLKGLTQGLVLGPFQIQAPLGKGGMGCVYLALDVRTKNHIALKILIPRKAQDSDRYLARFQREKELSQRVWHPHLALTFEAGSQGNLHYIAMEFIPGLTLFRLVSRQGPLSVARAARLFAEVADGLAHAHQQGLIHRDMKPSNIMVTPNDHAKVLDLGLAFIEGEVVESVEVQGGKGYLVGSLDYMAPEQTYDSSQVDPRSDIYGMGCCLYFALTGKPPFPVATVRLKLFAQRKLDPEPIETKNAEIPAKFAAIVRKMMAKNPADRYANAQELADELRTWSDGKIGEGPVEVQGDAAFRAAVQRAATSVGGFELVSEDEVLFAVNPNAPTPPPEPAPVEFEPVKPWRLPYWDRLPPDTRWILVGSILVFMILSSLGCSCLGAVIYLLVNGAPEWNREM